MPATSPQWKVEADSWNRTFAPVLRDKRLK
jgi:hypothetical protein